MWDRRDGGDFQFRWRVVLDGLPRHKLCLSTLHLFRYLCSKMGDGVGGHSRAVGSTIHRLLHLCRFPGSSRSCRATVGRPFVQELSRWVVQGQSIRTHSATMRLEFG